MAALLLDKHLQNRAVRSTSLCVSRSNRSDTDFQRHRASFDASAKEEACCISGCSAPVAAQGRLSFLPPAFSKTAAEKAGTATSSSRRRSCFRSPLKHKSTLHRRGTRAELDRRRLSLSSGSELSILFLSPHSFRRLSEASLIRALVPSTIRAHSTPAAVRAPTLVPLATVLQCPHHAHDPVRLLGPLLKSTIHLKVVPALQMKRLNSRNSMR